MIRSVLETGCPNLANLLLTEIRFSIIAFSISLRDAIPICESAF